MRYLAISLAVAVASCGNPDSASDKPEPPGQPAAITFAGAQAANPADRLAHGERLAKVLGCTGCHGDDLTGEEWSEPGFGRLWTANLTRAAPKYSDAGLARVIKGGKRPDRDLWEMPSHLFTQLSNSDMAALIAFLRTKAPAGDVHPEPLFEERARREIAAGTFKPSSAQVSTEGKAWPPDAGVEHALGRYVVRATCAECHRMDLRGGQPNPAATRRPDLRMVAAYDLEQFKHLLRTGKAAGDRELDMMSGVARGRYKHLTDAEVTAVHRYLQRVAQMAP